MKFKPTSEKMNKAFRLFAATIMLVAGAGQSALAQGMQGGQNDFGGSPDSLLPPEVVPLDPSAANKLMQSQAQSRAAQMSMPEAQGGMPSAPGGDPMNGMQSAQDARRAAYDQLMGQNQVTPINRSYQNQFPGAQGGPGTGMGPSFTPVANNYGGPGGPGGQTSQSGWTQPGQGGSQTLTGGVNYNQQRRDIRRAGFSNALSAVAGLGTGLMLGSLVSRSYYSSPVGLGALGLGMTGFGLRNGFRW
jgi:hypothetical protein